MLNNRIIGRMISDMRKSRGLTQEQLGQELHVTKQAVSTWETGKHCPDCDIIERLSNEYNLDFTDLTATKEANNTVCIKPLKAICSMDELETAIDTVMGEVKLDTATVHTVRTLLELALYFATGHVVYYQKDFVKDALIDWGSVAWELTNLYDTSDIYPMDNTNKSRFWKDCDITAAKIHCICTLRIGAELFEDFAPPERFDRTLGRYAEGCGYDLVRLLPKIENSILTSFKVGLYNLADVLYELYSDEQSNETTQDDADEIIS